MSARHRPESTARRTGVAKVAIPLLGLIIAVSILPAAASAKTSLGSQRVGTSAGSFLRIGLGARPVAMAGAFVAICDDITACAWNPAGLTHVSTSQIALNHIRWPADVRYDHACYGVHIPRLDGTVALQFGSLSTELIETQEYYPYGTGRTFTFADWLVGLSIGKRFTDKFSGGFGVKYVREESGTEIGGPATNALVLDAGTQYEIGPKNMRLAVALMNFGPDLMPNGTFKKKTGTATADAQYAGFAPATEFKFGIAFEPVRREWLQTVVDLEMCHPADNAETLRLGGEAVISSILAVRGGYDINADELKISMGVGVMTKIYSRRASLDYSATLSDYLGTIHRLSMLISF